MIQQDDNENNRAEPSPKSTFINSASNLRVKISINREETQEQFEEFSIGFKEELMELPHVYDVKFLSTRKDIPDGVRSGEMLAPMGEFMISVLGTTGFVAAMRVLEKWVGSNKRSFRIDFKNHTYEGINFSKQELQKFLDFIEEKEK
jgi:hypothetical protein